MGGIVSAFTNTVHQAWIAVMQFASAASIGDADELEPPPEDCFYVENNYIFTPLCSSTPTAPVPLTDRGSVKAALKARGWRPVPNSVALGVRANASTEKEFAKRIAR